MTRLLVLASGDVAIKKWKQETQEMEEVIDVHHGFARVTMPVTMGLKN
jgi:hypothetical protein